MSEVQTIRAAHSGQIKELSTLGTDVVLVERIQDLPDPVNDVITLEPKVYVPNGQVDLGTAQLVAVSGTNIMGRVFGRDGFVTSNPGALITKTANSNFVICAKLTNTLGTIFNIADGNTLAFRCDIEGDAGRISCPIAQFIACIFNDFEAGIEFEAGNTLDVESCLFNQNSGASGACVDITGAWQSFIKVSDCLFNVFGTGIQTLAGNTNLGASGRGSIDGCSFRESGVASNVDTDALRWLVRNNEGLSSSLSASDYRFNNNAVATTNPGVGTWVKIAGVTTSALERRFDNSTDNRAEYIDEFNNKAFNVEYSLGAQAVGVGANAEFGVSLNGADPIIGAGVQLITGFSIPVSSFSIQNLSQNDYVEIWARNVSNASDILVTRLEVLVSALASGT